MGKSSRRRRISLLGKYKSIKVASIVGSLLVLLSSAGAGGGLGLSEVSDERDGNLSGVGDSSLEGDTTDMEMSEYLLDDEVRFVTEDDFLYEEDRGAHYHDFHQSARSIQYERCPPLPEPQAVEPSGLCEAKRCQSDDQCSADGSVICCYNGCVYSCLPKVNPPLAFDWVEETDLKGEGGFTDPSTGNGASLRSLLAVEGKPETVSLPGGCYVSSKQYEDLAMFKRYDHVKACSCSNGDVFCEINKQPLEIKG